MSALEIVSAVLIGVGLVFFGAGTAGMLRFPDIFTRLHALTKADNIGLGFVVAGLSVTAENAMEIVELFAVWGLVMLASTTTAHIISAMALEQGVEPWVGGKTGGETDEKLPESKLSDAKGQQ